ncbi:MAG: cytochrome c-type biogenesis CcmF C-terminal domain-containing protein [Sandaracinaceae bacterium]
MPTIDIPTLGTILLSAVLVSAGYTFAMSVAAARGRPQLLRSARFGTFATVALVVCAVFLLAYAFQSHDFRIRYVARYSDRSMSPLYLWTALWGGQDGSLLWWTFLLSGYITAFTWWIGDRYRELQPVIWATLMSIVSFFVILQLFASNPFAIAFGAPPADGEGLNPLLQNYWMAIHPPALYMGLTGWAVPFSIVFAALVTGRLGTEWVHAARRWVLLAWGFLSLGNMLGMFWSYEELGWGGYWAWDPVENASFLPWLTGTAYLHSVMILERRNSMKVWSTFLLCLTFILTIFGTFLTRSGLIASVHSFARSDIGNYFGVYLIGLCAVVFLVMAWRLPDLRGRRIGPFDWFLGTAFGILTGIYLVIGDVVDSWAARIAIVLVFDFAVLLLWAVEKLRIDLLNIPSEGVKRHAVESLLSREFAFLMNNWILLGMAVFVLMSTTHPLFSELLRDITVTVGPGWYNKWMVPFAIILLFLTGVGPLIAWRKATGKNLIKAFRFPMLFAVLVFGLHLAAGESVGFAPFVPWDEMFGTYLDNVLGPIYGVAPLLSSTACAFVFGTIVQEFYRGAKVRRKNKGENWIVALFELVSRARRRYGGYVVHFGIVVMFLGFTGAAYDVEEETSLMPGETMSVDRYTVRYDTVRMEEDPNKRAVYTDMTILVDGDEVAQVAPAKFIYRSHPEMPTTEVAIHTTWIDDLYVIMSVVDPETRRGTFRIIRRPLVPWIWLGGLFLLFGTFIAIMPRLKDVVGEVRVPTRTRAGAMATLAIFFLTATAVLAMTAQASAQSDSSSSLHAGTVVIQDPDERRLFASLLCECGDCQRLPLDTCGCSFAEGMRAELRGRLSRGDDHMDIVNDYRERFGAQSIAVPADEGLDRALWAVPIAAFVLAGIGLVFRARSWAAAGAAASQELANQTSADEEYDALLDDELRDLEGD